MTYLLQIAFLIAPCFSMEILPPNIETIVVGLNTPYKINAKPTDSIYIKDRILKIRSSNENTFVVGTKTGFTLIKISGLSTNVQVLSAIEFQNHTEFLKTFINHPSIQISYSESGAKVSGQILLDTDFFTLLEWLDYSVLKPKFELEFENLNLKNYALDLLSTRLGIQVTEFGSAMNLTFNKSLTKEEKDKVIRLGFSLNQDNTNGANLGVLDIQFISITDSELKKLSPVLPTEFQWTVDQKIKLLTQIFNSNYNLSENLNKKSSLINLMLFENEKTEYHSGGEFAIQQKSIYRNDVQWKTFGLFVEATPMSLNKSEVKLDIKVKMSYLTSSNENQPSLSQDSWQQRLRLKKNQSLVVTNSLTNMFSRNKTNHLLLKSIPILNSLFYGKDTNKENSHIYMLIRMNENKED
jgi:hypothetical protein